MIHGSVHRKNCVKLLEGLLALRYHHKGMDRVHELRGIQPCLSDMFVINATFFSFLFLSHRPRFSHVTWSSLCEIQVRLKS
jgi:hypothetical protein